VNKDLGVKGLIVFISEIAMLYFLFSGTLSCDRLMGLIEFTVGAFQVAFGLLFTIMNSNKEALNNYAHV